MTSSHVEPSPNLTIPETCTYLKLGRTSVYGLISDGVLETIKIGERRLVKLRSAKKLAENGTEYCRPIPAQLPHRTYRADQNTDPDNFGILVDVYLGIIVPKLETY